MTAEFFAEGLHILNRDAQQLRSLTRPLDSHERNERHNVFAVRPLRVDTLAARDPGFENTGDGKEKPFDAFFYVGRHRAGEDRRQLV